MIKDSIKIEKGFWEALICPRLGGNIIKLAHKGKDILMPLLDEAELKVNPYLYGAPIIMPANRTYKGEFTFEGKEYHLPINEPRSGCNLHGSVLFEEFEVIKSSLDSVTLRLLDEEARSYPFPFELTITYGLTEQGLYSEYTVRNIGSQNMPLTFCTHTTFVSPQIFSVPITLCQESDSVDVPTGRYIPLDEQEQKYVSGSPSQSIYISGYYLSGGQKAEVGDYIYEVSDNFDHWVFYNGGKESGFLCIEPQAGAVNGLNIEGGHLIVKKGDKVRFTTLISEK